MEHPPTSMLGLFLGALFAASAIFFIALWAGNPPSQHPAPQMAAPAGSAQPGDVNTKNSGASWRDVQ